jgi:translocation protein SEC66
VPDSILRAALLARAQEDISRIIEIRTRKQALSTLLARGVVGDEIWQRLLRAEQELELEVKDVVQEVCLFMFIYVYGSPNFDPTSIQRQAR